MHPTSEPIWQDQLAESLIQSINVWVNVCDTDLNILVWNPTAERICGYSAEEVVGHARCWEWFYPDPVHRREVIGMTAQVLSKDGSLRGVETEIICKNGDLKTIAWYSRPLVDSRDMVQGFVTFGYDATDKKLAERALQKAHNELHVLYEIASITNEISNLNLILERSLERILSVMKSSGGTVHLWDSETERLLPTAARGIEPECYPAAAFVNEVYCQARYICAPRVQADSRVTFWGVPMRAKGQIHGVISILVDADVQISPDDLALLTSIADQIGIAVENARLYRQSQQLAVAEERRRLARDLHDSVTQSLYSLTLFAEAGQRLLRSGEIERVDKYLDRLNTTAQDALKEMRLLLYELRPWALESGKLIETIQHRLDSVERRSGLTAHLITTPLPGLPPRYEDNLYHITLEALNNALKHAFASVVTVQLRADEHMIYLDVIDNGGGFDPTTVLKFGGMGLSNMRERAEELGGTFTIESSDARGTSVKACLPFDSVMSTMKPLISVLIVDDHPIVREGLHALISTELDMRIVGEAANGVDAVRMARDLKPDVILLDLMMEPMSGIEAIERIKADNPKAHILALTSFAEDEIVFPAIKAGALGYLLKDSAPNDLLQAVHNVYLGIPSLAPSIALKLMREIDPVPDAPSGSAETLTEREILILKQVAQGLTNQEIAQLLVISERTVRNHVGSILSKLRLANRTQAALYALREGIVRLDEHTPPLSPTE